MRLSVSSALEVYQFIVICALCDLLITTAVHLVLLVVLCT